MSRQGGFFSGGWSKVWDLVKDYGIYGPEALLKTPGLYLVPEQRNKFLSIFWGILEGFSRVCGVFLERWGAFLRGQRFGK